MSGSGRATTGRFAVSLDPVSFARRRRAAALTATAEGQLRDGRLSLQATAAPVAGPPATLRGDVPLAVDLEALTVSQPAGEALDARLEWQGDAADLMVMLPMNDHVLRGPARLALWLGGTAGAPALSGEVTLEGGYYEHLVAGTVLTPLELRLVGDGDSLSIDRLEAGTGDSGRITGSGELGLDRAARFPASFRFDFTRARLIRRDELTTVGDGQITVSGPVLAPDVAGRLELREVEARLQNSLPPDVVQLELVESTARRRGSAHGGIAPGEPAPVAQPEGAGSLAVEIRMPQRVFVRGLGIDSEWQGRLGLGGTPAQPSITGQLELVRGVMFFLGRRFRLQDSVIRFPGGGEIEPELDVRAVYEGRYYVVTIAITGPASASEIKLTSVPELPESEILSQALFSKSTGELTALEAVQLASAVSELTGRSSGPGQLLGRVRQAVGIDVLRLGSRETETGEQATSVEAGVYVTEGLYVGAETSTAEESGVVSVEYELTERIRVKTDLEQTGGQNIGIEYKRDY
jgi:translocation and assembly module TamB